MKIELSDFISTSAEGKSCMHLLRIWSLSVLLVAVHLPAPGVAQTADDAAYRRQAVERSLVPAILVEGRATDWTIEQRMARYNVPGLSLALIRDGSIDWTAEYGSTGRTGSGPVTTSTLFQAASLSKPVAALVALKLVQDGRLSLDDDVDRYLRSWRIPENRFTAARPVTLRALLSHSAGVNVSGFPGYPQSETIPTLLQILEGSGPANSLPVRVDEVPGSGYRYSGGGYQIVQLIIEDVTSRPFDELARELVFAPLEMDRSTFAVTLSTADAHAAAAGHRYNGEPISGGWRSYPEQAAASLWSTADDLAKFAIGVIRAFRGADGAVLDAGLATEMVTRQAGDAGLGLGVHGQDAGLHFDHAGWTGGYRAYMIGYPVTGDGLVVMANGDGGNDLINEILRSVAHVYGWPDFRPTTRSVAAVPRSTLEAYSGRYYVDDYDLTITVIADEDHLLLSTPRGSRYTFYPASESDFFSIEDGSTLEIVRRGHEPDELRLWGMVARRSTSR
jgi:CubicO group peptidase (beta-lactamase class C family)